MDAFAACLSCLGISTSRHHAASIYGPDERTALLDPDSLPPAQPEAAPITTEEELRHQEALRRIVDQTSDRIIAITGPTPLLQVQMDELSTSPALTGSTDDLRPNSVWRAYDPPSTPIPNDDRMKAPRDFERLDGSIHSLRTLTNHQGDSSEFGTIATYKTAREQANGYDSDEVDMTSSPTPKSNKLVNMWPPAKDLSASESSITPSQLVVSDADDDFMRRAAEELDQALTTLDRDDALS